MELVSIDKTSGLSFILMVAIGRVVDNTEAITSFLMLMDVHVICIVSATQ